MFHIFKLCGLWVERNIEFPKLESFYIINY